MTVPSAEEVLRRLDMALAEAGYPSVVLTWWDTREDGWPQISSSIFATPDAIWWQACDIAYEGRIPCWSCYNTPTYKECRSGNCAHPEGPSRPPKELLSRDPSH